MKQCYVGLYALDTWKLNSRATLNYGLRWEPGIAQQIRNGAIYNFNLDRYLRDERSTVFPNAPAGFLYPGDPGFVNGNAGHGRPLESVFAARRLCMRSRRAMAEPFCAAAMPWPMTS